MANVSGVAKQGRTAAILAAIRPCLTSSDTVLDIGAGSCKLSRAIKDSVGATVTPVDVVDRNRTHLKLTLYDGEHLPFQDNTFSVGLMVFVLHHAGHPEATLREALRVCRKLIIIESTAKSIEASPLFTLYRMGHRGTHHHPKDTPDWEQLFTAAGGTLLDAKPLKSMFILGPPRPYRVYVVAK